MDATNVPLVAGLAPVMAAAAWNLPEQTHVLRGSLASQSLAADLSNQVFQAMEMVQGNENNVEVANNGGGIINNGIGNTLETVAVQTILAAVPMMFRSIMAAAGKGCERRKATTDPNNADGHDVKTPPKELKKPISTPGASPIGRGPKQYKMSSGSSDGEFSHDVNGLDGDGDMDSLDLRDSSMNTVEKRERGDRILSNLHNANLKSRVLATRLKEKMKDMETQHSEVLARLTKEIQEIKKNEESTTNHDHNGPTSRAAKGETADKEPTLPGPLSSTTT